MELNYSIGLFQWFSIAVQTCYYLMKKIPLKLHGTPQYLFKSRRKRLRKCPQFSPAMFFREKEDKILAEASLISAQKCPRSNDSLIHERRFIQWWRCGIHWTDSKRKNLHCKPVRMQKKKKKTWDGLWCLVKYRFSCSSVKNISIMVYIHTDIQREETWGVSLSWCGCLSVGSMGMLSGNTRA